MVEVLDQDKRKEDRHSSKGNQLKWNDGKYWYKADYTGYEGMAEYIVSSLLRYSDLKPEEYVSYRYCPIFDQGAALLSDTTLDYPMGTDVMELLPKPEAKTFCSSFEEQLDIAEELYGEQIHFSFGEKEIRGTLEKDKIYSEEVKKRVFEVLRQQRRKYQYRACL